jgi:tetratricopeptide (TPR) repeat protein
MNCRIWLSVTVLLLAQRPGAAQTSLKWQFEETRYLDVRHVAKMDITFLGMTKETESTTRFLFSLRPVKVGLTATILDVTVLACEDSSVSRGADPEKDIFKGFKGQKFRLTIRAANQGFELATPKGLAEAVLGDDVKNGTEDERQFAADLVETILRAHLIDAIVPLPGKAVSAGDKWRNTMEVKMQPLAQVTTDREYVFVGRQIYDGKRVDAVTWSGKVELKPLRDEKGLFPFKIKEMKSAVKPQSEGTVLWDESVNRPVRVDCLLTYELDMVVESKGKVVKGKGKGSDTFVIRYSANNPDTGLPASQNPPPPSEHQRNTAVEADWIRFEVAARSADQEELLGILKDILKKDPTNKDALARQKMLESGEGEGSDRAMLALVIRIHLRNSKNVEAVREAKKLYAIEPEDWISNCILAQDAIVRKDGPAIDKHLAAVHDPKKEPPPDLGGLLYAIEMHKQAGREATPLRNFVVDKVIPNLKNANLSTIHPAGRIQILACYVDTCLSAEDTSVSILWEYWPWAKQLADGIYSDASRGRTALILSQLGTLQPALGGVVARFHRHKLIGESETVDQLKQLERFGRRVWAALRTADPKNPSGYTGEIYALIRAGELDTAKKTLDAGLAGCGEWNVPLLIAAAAWAKAAGKSPEFLPTLLVLAKKFPENLVIWQIVTDVAEAANRRDLAIEAIQKTREQFPANHWYALEEARLWANADRYEKSLTVLTSLPEPFRFQNPDFARAYARALSGSGEGERLRSVSQLITETAEKENAPELAIAHLQGLMDAPAAATGLEHAVELADRATRRWPTHKGVIALTAKVKFRAVESGDPPWQNSRGLAAVAALERALTSDPHDPWYSATLAWVRIKANVEPDRAWDDSAPARSALTGPALPAEVLEALGVIYLSRKDYESAIVVLNRAVGSAPKPAGPYILLAVAYYGKGDKDKAREAFDKAKNLPKSARVLIEYKAAAELVKD